MGKSAEWQAAYRARHLKDGTDCRLSMVVSANTAAMLAKLARHHGITQREALERIVADAERALCATLDHDALREFDAPLKRRSPR